MATYVPDLQSLVSCSTPTGVQYTTPANTRGDHLAEQARLCITDTWLTDQHVGSDSNLKRWCLRTCTHMHAVACVDVANVMTPQTCTLLQIAMFHLTNAFDKYKLPAVWCTVNGDGTHRLFFFTRTKLKLTICPEGCPHKNDVLRTTKWRNPVN